LKRQHLREVHDERQVLVQLFLGDDGYSIESLEVGGFIETEPPGLLPEQLAIRARDEQLTGEDIGEMAALEDQGGGGIGQTTGTGDLHLAAGWGHAAGDAGIALDAVFQGFRM